jgi:hypothetical protein
MRHLAARARRQEFAQVVHPGLKRSHVIWQIDSGLVFNEKLSQARIEIVPWHMHPPSLARSWLSRSAQRFERRQGMPTAEAKA